MDKSGKVETKLPYKIAIVAMILMALIAAICFAKYNEYPVPGEGGWDPISAYMYDNKHDLVRDKINNANGATVRTR